MEYTAGSSRPQSSQNVLFLLGSVDAQLDDIVNFGNFFVVY